MAVLLVGVGYVGSSLARALVARGEEVWGLCRSERALPEGVRAMRGDAGDRATLRALPTQPVQVVIATSAGSRTCDAYRAGYVRVAETIRESYPQARLIFVSSSSVYGQDDGGVVDDRTPRLPTTPTAQVLSQAEDVLLERNQTVVRASGIYGPGRTRLLARLAAPGAPDGTSAGKMTNRIHRDDLAGILEFLLARTGERGSFIASDERPASHEEIRAWILQRSEGNPFSDPGPSGVGAGDPEPHRAAPGQGKRLHSSRLAGLGYAFRYPSFEQGYAPLLDSEPDGNL